MLSLGKILKMSFNNKYSDYSEVLDEENNPCTPKSEKSNGQRFSEQSSQLFNTIIWVLHAIVITIYIVGGIQWHRMVPARCFDSMFPAITYIGLKKIPDLACADHANVPVVWQDQTLRTQFINGSFVDPWGRPNPATNAKWDNLLDGIYALSLTSPESFPIAHSGALEETKSLGHSWNHPTHSRRSQKPATGNSASVP